MRQESIRYCYLKLIFVNLLSQMTVIEEVAKNELELNWVATLDEHQYRNEINLNLVGL